MMERAKEIAEIIYPDEYKDVGGGLMVDQNANLRAVAEDVVAFMLESLRSEKTASAVMHAFFRREHRREPTEEEKPNLTAHMSTALLAAEYQPVQTK